MISRHLLFAALLSCACHGGSPGPSAGSNSNWLQRCETNTTCATHTSCECGGCTRGCTKDSECAGLADARCVLDGDAALRSMCGESSGRTGLCLPACEAGSCGAGRVCVLGACVLAPLPSVDACSALSAPSDTERTREDDLLDKFERMRLEGGVVCGSEPPTTPGLALRFDPRLACAARLLATDLNVTRAHSLIDSLGRGSGERLGAAGYRASLWAEGYNFGATSAERALELVLSDSTACKSLTLPGLVDVGVAHVGDVDVLTVAAE